MTRQLMWGKLLTYLALALGAAGMMLPLLWMISTSLKPPGATMTYPPEFLPRSQELFTDPRTGRKLPEQNTEKCKFKRWAKVFV